jgi:hypothetical protein
VVTLKGYCVSTANTFRQHEKTEALQLKRQEHEGYRLFWGDLHRQTAATCGEGSIRENFTVCRQEFGMDFCAITDNATITEDPADRLLPGPRLSVHRHFKHGKQAHSVPPGYWDELAAEVARAHRPGEFVPVLAYEWCSTRWGDRNVYYPSESGPLHLPGDVYSLLDSARANGAMVMPHHVGYAPGRRGTDWDVHDPRVVRLAEIYSTQHGCSELEEGNRYPLWSNSMGGNAPGNSLTSALLRGIHIGFNGGTDSHQLRQKPGLTGVWAKDATRESLWEALWNRRTVAATGARIGILFTAEGAMQGSAVATDRHPQLRIEVEAPERLLRVELIRHGRVIRTWHPADPAFSASFTDAEQPACPDTWYYVRATAKNGELAWSSPVWVSFLPEAPFARDILYWLPRPRLQWAVIPVAGGFLSRLRHVGCARDGAIGVTGIAGGSDLAGGRLPLSLAPGEVAEVSTEAAAGGQFRLTMQEADGETWNLLRHTPTVE